MPGSFSWAKRTFRSCSSAILPAPYQGRVVIQMMVSGVGNLVGRAIDDGAGGEPQFFFTWCRARRLKKRPRRVTITVQHSGGFSSQAVDHARPLWKDKVHPRARGSTASHPECPPSRVPLGRFFCLRHVFGFPRAGDYRQRGPSPLLSPTRPPV